MTREEKKQVIEDLTSELSEVKNFYLTDIAGLNSSETSALRRLCFKSNVKLSVVKNTLLSKAMEASERDFGDLKDGTKKEGSGASNAVRGLFMSCSGPGNNNSIEYITIAQLGNAIDFGDLSNNAELAASVASSTRGVAGGGTSPTKINTIEYVQIATTGDAVDFGDRTVAGYGAAGMSNGHGGLG